ncbi:MAG: DUF87 domain-containing protein [Candidatus Micrarchaeota archaeon]
MELGTVISTMDSPTTNRFSFVIANASVVRKARFVQLQTEEGTLLGVVQDIVRANRYFERAESVSEYEKNGKNGKGINSSFQDNFPTSEWEFAVAECAVLGAYDTNLRRASFPAAPGAKVHDADLKLLKDFFAFEDGGLNIGKLLVHDLDVKLNMNKLFQKHLAILGISGSGKSVTTAVMIEELLSRKKESGRLAAVIFDAHGEYVSFSDKRHNSEFADKVSVINASKVQIAAKNLSPGLISKLLPGISHTQMRDLAPILSKMKKDGRERNEVFGLGQIVQNVQASDMKENVKDALLSWLFELRNLKIVGEHDAPFLKKTIKPGMLTVFDLSSIVNMLKKQIIVSYISEKMFALRRKEELPPYVMIVEEAHNFAPEKAEKKYAISKGIINTIAREGRKFGASLCLISQRPVQLSTTALSQCVTPETLITKSDNENIAISDLKDSYEANKVLSFDETRTGIQESGITHYLKKEPENGDTVTIETTETGKKVTATKDHPFWVKGKGWTPLREISIKDKVATLPQSNNIFDSDNEEKTILGFDEFEGNITGTLNGKRASNLLRELGLLPLTTKNTKLPLIARLMGHIFGDGSLNKPYKGKYGSSLVKTAFSGKEEDLKLIQKDLGELGFDGSNKIFKQYKESIVRFTDFGIKHIRGNSIQFKRGTVHLWAFLAALEGPIGDKSRTATKVPSWIMNGPLRVKKEFLAAYFGSECEAPKIRKESERCPATLHCPFSKLEGLRDEGIAFYNQIEKLLLAFGVTSKLYIRNGVICKDGKKTLQFIINIDGGRKNIINFSRNIGFRYSVEREKNRRIVQAYLEMVEHLVSKREKVFQTVVSSANIDIWKLSRETGIKAGTLRTWKRLRTLQYLKAPVRSPTFEEWLKDATDGLEDGLVWETVDNLAPTISHDVRDITIPNGHSFFANGFLTHNCNTMLIMRITNPYDLKHIAESAEAIDANTQNQISSLRVGEGVLIGEAVNYPVFIRVRNRKTKKLSKGESLEELAKRFEEKLSLADAISDADVNDAFLQ